MYTSNPVSVLLGADADWLSLLQCFQRWILVHRNKKKRIDRKKMNRGIKTVFSWKLAVVLPLLIPHLEFSFKFPVFIKAKYVRSDTKIKNVQIFYLYLEPCLQR